MNYTKFKNYKDEVLKVDSELKDLYEKEELNYQVSIQLKRLREKKRISQYDLAKKIGTTQSVIARIESGNSNISMKTFGKILTGLGAKLKIVD